MNEIKKVKAKDFDWDGFRRKEFYIVMCSKQSVISTLKFLSEKGYVWGVTGTSLTEDNIAEGRLLCNVKRELIYIYVGGTVNNGIGYIKHSFLYNSDAINAVEIDFEEESDMNTNDIKRVKTKDFDNAAFKRGEFDIVMRSPKSVSRTLQFLHDKGYVWGFSKTSLVEDDGMRETLLSSARCCPVFIIAYGDIHNGVLSDLMPSSDTPPVELIFEEETSNNKIVITNDGKITTATLYSNGKREGIGTAICHDDDVFDIYTGAQLALERLEKKQKGENLSNWEKFIKGKVDMRVPKKHMKNFIDRAMQAGLEFRGEMTDWYLRWLETDGDTVLISVVGKNTKIPFLSEILHRDYSHWLGDEVEEIPYIPGMK